MSTRRTVAMVLVAASLLIANACSDTEPTRIERNSDAASPSLSSPNSSAIGVNVAVVQLHRNSLGGYDNLPTSSPTGALTFHNLGGTNLSPEILDHTNTYAIFWGPSWTNQTFVGDKITTIQSFFAGFGGSNYANTVTEYGALNQSTFVSTIMDNAVAPDGDPGTTILGGHLCALLDSRGLTPDSFGFYAMFSTGHYPADYIGRHAKYTCHSTVIHFAIIWNLDDHNFVNDNVYHTTRAAGLVNVAAHELTEAITDADVSTGWFATNASGEIADKCNFSFGPSPYVTLHNGGVFKLQGQWSNAAFSARTGFGNGNLPSEPGCINSAAAWVHGTVSGPTTMRQYQQSTFVSNVTGGTPPYRYYWTITSYPQLTFGYSSNSSPNFTVELYSPVSTYVNYIVRLYVTDALGHAINPQAPQLSGTAYP
jgi:hypothetical protein